MKGNSLVIRSKKYLKIFFLSIIGLSVLMIGVTSLTASNTSVDDTGPYIGFFAPDFTLNDIEGNPYDFSDKRGKPVVLLFWASWCSVCKTTIPELQSVYLELSKDDVEIILVNMTSQDQLPSVLSYIKENNIILSTLLDSSGEVASAYNIRALPTGWIIDPKGIIQSVIIGNGLTSAYIRSQLIDMDI